LKDIAYFENYTTDGYTGPAFKVGAGVQAREIYDPAFEKGLVVVGGVCDVRNFVLFIHLERKFSNKKIVSRVVRRIFARRWAFYAQFPPHPTP
jgi:hypothetical protein